jgi:YbgC/YbaW family acyl-CoA thioester hydrolase
MPEPFRTTRRIEFVDTDMAGIVHFSNFFRFMESAEVELLRSRGLAVVMEWQGQRLSFPRVAARCDYLKPVRFEDEVEILVRLARLGRKSLTYQFTFRLHGQTVAEGQVSCVCCKVAPEAHTLESIEIPENIRERLQDLQGG